MFFGWLIEKPVEQESERVSGRDREKKLKEFKKSFYDILHVLLQSCGLKTMYYFYEIISLTEIIKEAICH